MEKTREYSAQELQVIIRRMPPRAIFLLDSRMKNGSDLYQEVSGFAAGEDRWCQPGKFDVLSDR